MHHYPCGCRPSTVKRKGHRPGCMHFDLTKHHGRRRVAQFRRNWQDRTASMDHARGVILSA